MITAKSTVNKALDIRVEIVILYIGVAFFPWPADVITSATGKPTPRSTTDINTANTKPSAMPPRTQALNRATTTLSSAYINRVPCLPFIASYTLRAGSTCTCFACVAKDKFSVNRDSAFLPNINKLL